MVKRRGALLTVLALAVLGATGFWLARGTNPAPPAATSAPRATRGGRAVEIPRIDLARLSGPRPETKVGRRDLFAFEAGGSKPDDEGTLAPPVTLADVPPVSLPSGPPPPPPMNLKYIGNLESKQGLKVAVLMTDRREVLTGQVGELLANRFRIVKIGLESVDIQEVADGRIRRIPLRGN
jgi:hypothetical protein